MESTNQDRKSSLRKLRQALLQEDKKRMTPISDKDLENSGLRDLFPSRRFGNLLDRIESYVNVRHMRTSDASGFGLSGSGRSSHNSDQSTSIAPISVSNLRVRPSGKSADDLRSIADSVNTFGLNIKKTRKGGKLLGAEGTQTQTYAGITHSDLDIQYQRPPLMHQMHVVEWLWLQSANFHRFLIMLIVLLFCVFFANIIFAGICIGGSLRTKQDSPYVCRSLECETMSKRILSTMSQSINPCDDFYEFVCGPNVSGKENEFWTFGTNFGRIKYNFHASITLGKMLKKHHEFPVTLILPFYKACLNEESRNKKGLKPFYDMLKNFSLYSVDKNGEYALEDVITAITSILTHSIKQAAILQDNYYKDSSGKLHMYVASSVPTYYTTEGVVSYSYDYYKDAIKKAFTHLTELNVPAGDLDVIAHDIICLEFYIQEKVGKWDISKILEGTDPSIAGKTCPSETAPAAQVSGNFGKPALGDFDWTMFAQQIYAKANGGSSNPHKWDPTTDPRQSQKFLKALGNLFRQSSAIRLLRYLQWRLFYYFSDDLDEKSVLTTINVRRHYFREVTGCGQRIFDWLPFLAPDTYMHSFSKSVLKVQQDFANLVHLMRSTYYKVISRNKFREYESWIGKSLTPREINLLREILAASMRTEHVAPVTFEDRFFIRFRELYEGITFSEEDHFENLMKMGFRRQQWQITKKYSDIFYSINPKFHVPVWMDKIQGAYDKDIYKQIVYMPFSTIEVPYFYGGLFVSNLGGLAWVDAGVMERSKFSKLRGRDTIVEFLDKERKLLEGNNAYTMVEINKTIASLVDFMDKYFRESKYLPEYERGEWKVAREVVRFKYQETINKSFEHIFVDQKRYHVLTTLMDDYFAQPENWRHSKVVLEGLEKYNAKQLFYINQVSMRCAKLSRKYLDHIKELGPLLYLTRVNRALSNLDHFSKTFKCPEGSKMNPKEKLYYWDRDINISNFQYKESTLDFV